jgi:hypothetical protein
VSFWSLDWALTFPIASSSTRLCLRSRSSLASTSSSSTTSTPSARSSPKGDLVNLVPVLLLQNLVVSNLNDLACNAADLNHIVGAIVSQTLNAIKDLDHQYLHIIDDINSGLGGDILGMSDDDGLRLAFDKYLQGVSDWLAGSLEWH